MTVLTLLRALAAAAGLALAAATAPSSGAVLIPPACATTDPVQFPCPAGTEQAGIRW